ncbi:hypothetical protein OAA38_00830 [bacterium]|nr:hypothetical protein [bacterium]
MSLFFNAPLPFIAGATGPIAINPEAGLTLTSSHSIGVLTNGDFAPSQNAVFACELTWPTSWSSSQNRNIWEMGGTGTGAGIGLVSNGSTLSVLRLSAGDGANNPGTASTTADVDISTSNFTNETTGTLAWDIRINPGRVRVWWNGVLYGTGSTSGGGELAGSKYAGSAPGSYITGFTGTGSPNALNPDYNFTSSSGAASDSTLRQYQNQLVLF